MNLSITVRDALCQGIEQGLTNPAGPCPYVEGVELEKAWKVGVMLPYETPDSSNTIH